MAAKQIDTSKIKKLLFAWKEWLLIAFLAIIFILMLVILAQSGQKTAEDYMPKVELQKQQTINFPKESAEAVAKTIAGMKSFDESDYKTKLLSRNLFDFRDVMTRYDFEKKIADKLKAAQAFFDQQNYDETIRLCEEILAQDSARQPAIKLKNKAEKAKASAQATTN
ncbi:MAG: hypothetical protein N3A72_09445 [bacterium]|nr:hypothetical protein [bacterium]